MVDTDGNQCRIVVLISGNGSNLQAVIDAVKAGTIPASIVAVVSNRPAAYGLERARQAAIPVEVLEYPGHPDREAYDRALIQLIDSYRPDLILLAGFMRILSHDFVEHYTGRLLNIHPSLLPRHKGLNTHQRVIEAGDTQHGATVHFVTPELDSGPIIIQGVIETAGINQAADLAELVHRVEHQIYPQAVQWFAEQRLALIDNQVTLDQQPISTQDKVRYFAMNNSG
ncbi:MAG: phosphoribosylglycinamide formyltransferase [Gammaproteobacteria bacterium]|nr:phosphoribosylglycinamide formyltransferase [Gammaproteobacteria bacterium]MDH5650979.1 phosphoribosylglycinamide formyltransferase [Gammaproteobacteria bacterium]